MATFKFICGPDDFLVQRKANPAWKAFVEEINDEHSCEVIDGDAGNVDEVEQSIARFISAIQTMSLFGEKKAVWFKNITFLADSVTGRAEGTAQRIDLLKDALSQIDPEAVKVLLTASPVDRRKKSFKWLQKESDFNFIDADKNEAGLAALIREEAKKAGYTFEPGASDILVSKLNGNTRLSLAEIEKLITYLGTDKKVISENLINELVPNFGEGDFFETVEAFYSGDIKWTLEAIHRHFFAGYDARPMIASLQNRNRLLIQLKSLQASGKIRSRITKNVLSDLENEFGNYFQDSTKSAFNVFTQNPWYLGRLLESAQKFNLKQLLQFQEAFIESFSGIISRSQEQESVMRETAIQCLAPSVKA